MAQEESFVFCQRNLKSEAFFKFEEMRDRQELVDFRLTIQKRSFVGHRVVLAAAIPYFRSAFDKTEGNIFLNEMDPDALESIINFAYTGKIEIAVGKVGSLLLASENLQMEKLTYACWRYLEKHLDFENVWDIRVLAEKHRCTEVQKTADEYIRENFEWFSHSPKFSSVDFSYLKEVISRDDVRVTSEEKVFEAVIRWVYSAPSERRNLFPVLLKEIRLLELSAAYLIKHVSSEELVLSSTQCKELIDQAKTFHWVKLLKKKRPRLSGLATGPRMYQNKSQNITRKDYIDHDLYIVILSNLSVSKRYAMKCLDAERKKWASIFDSLFKVHWKTAIVHVASYGEKIFVFEEEYYRTFDLTTYEWRYVREKYLFMYGSGLVVYHDKFYFVGSADKSFYLTAKCFDPQIRRWSPQNDIVLPIGLQYPGVACLDDFIYATGGSCRRPSDGRFHPETKEWNTISPMLHERYRHGCCSMNGKIYVCGGIKDRTSNDPDLNSAEVYDPNTDQWNLISPLNTSGIVRSLVANDGKLYALPDVENLLKKAICVEIYDPVNNKWNYSVPIPCNQKNLRMLRLVLVRSDAYEEGSVVVRSDSSDENS